MQSREILFLKINIKLINHCEKSIKIDIKEISFICNIIQIISENTQLLINKKYQEIQNNLVKIKLLLIDIFGNNSNKYSEIMNSILLTHYKNDYNIINRENYIRILISDKLIEKSYPIIQEIFNFESLEPLIIKENNINNNNLENEKYAKKFLSKFQKTNPVKEFINKIKNIKLNKIILYHFEIICNNYFQKLQNNINNNINKINLNINKKICGGLSKIYLEESINYLDQETNGQKHVGLNEVGKLYCIAYIKRYLIYYVDILLSENIQYLDERKEINQLLFEKNLKIRKIIKYYLLKICLEKFNNNYNKFVDFYNNNEYFGFKEYFNEIKFIEKKPQFIFTNRFNKR